MLCYVASCDAFGFHFIGTHSSALVETDWAKLCLLYGNLKKCVLWMSVIDECLGLVIHNLFREWSLQFKKGNEMYSILVYGSFLKYKALWRLTTASWRPYYHKQLVTQSIRLHSSVQTEFTFVERMRHLFSCEVCELSVIHTRHG